MLYLITKSYNSYDQFGEYFVGIFDTENKARKAFPKIGRNTSRSGHLDDEWYELHKIEPNKVYKWITNSELQKVEEG